MQIDQGNTAQAIPVWVGTTGLTLTAYGSKNGAATVTLSGAVAELAHGWYKIAANATDANTLGPLAVTLTDGTHFGNQLVDVVYSTGYNGYKAYESVDISAGVNIAEGLNISGGLDVSGGMTLDTGNITIGALDIESLAGPQIQYMLGLLGFNAGLRNPTGGSAAYPASWTLCMYDTQAHAELNDGVTGLLASGVINTSYDSSSNVTQQNTSINGT